ncbi:MAG: tetratricopeptide repeat protein [Gemmatimonadetes bacterium]|nr:tetratricopeptide repeat protein [Gemmatimonadota bacterium]
MSAVRRAADLVHEARSRERTGCIRKAIEGYDSAITLARKSGDAAGLTEALRRLAVLRHQRGESPAARALCRESYDVAQESGNGVLAAEALNTLGGLDLATGSLEDARANFLRALDLGGQSRELRARVEQNLGILANIHGELDEAMKRYRRSLEAYRGFGDEQGCALAYHNLGMVSTDRRAFDEAEGYFGQSHEIAVQLGDTYLQGLCLVNHAEVQVARQRFDEAQRKAEGALAVFDQLGARAAKASAYRVIGVVYRETGRPALAESRLRSSVELAIAAGSLLGEADASRELALLCQTMGRNQEALALLNAAHRLFRRLDARVDLVHVDGKMEELEGAYLSVVKEWGQSIESTDSYTYGHCERVAESAVAVGEALGPQAYHPLAPREVRRHGLSRPAARRRDPALGTGRRHRGRVRRADDRPILPSGAAGGGGTPGDYARSRLVVRPGVPGFLESHGPTGRVGQLALPSL